MATSMARSASHNPIRSADGTAMHAQARRSSAANGLDSGAASSSSKPTSPLLTPQSSMLAARRASSRSARLSQAMHNDGFYTPSYISTAAAVQASSPSRQTPPGATSSSSSYGFPVAISPGSQQQHFALPVRTPKTEINQFPVDVDEDELDYDVQGDEEGEEDRAYGGGAGNGNAFATQDERMYSISRLQAEATHVTQRLSALSMESQQAADSEGELRSLPHQSVDHASATNSSLLSAASPSIQRRHRRQGTRSTANSSCSESSHSSMDTDGSSCLAEIKHATSRRAMTKHDGISGYGGPQRAAKIVTPPSRSSFDGGRAAPATSYRHSSTVPPRADKVDERPSPSRHYTATTSAAAEQPISLPRRDISGPPRTAAQWSTDESAPLKDQKSGGGGGSGISSTSTSRRGSSGQHFVTSLLRRRSNSNSSALSSSPASADHQSYINVNQRAGMPTQTQTQTLPSAYVESTATKPLATWSSAPLGSMTRPSDDTGGQASGSEQQQQQPSGSGGALSLLQRRARKISGSLQRIGQGARPRSSSTSTNSSAAHVEMSADNNTGNGSGAHSPTTAAPTRTRKSSLTLASLHHNVASSRATSMSTSPPAFVSPDSLLLSANSMVGSGDVTSEVLRADDAGAYIGQSRQTATALLRSHGAYDVNHDHWTPPIGTAKERGDSDATITKTNQGALLPESQSTSALTQNQIRRKPVVPLPSYPPPSPSNQRTPLPPPPGPGKAARVRLSSAAPVNAAADEAPLAGSGSGFAGVLIPSNFGSSSSLSTPRTPNYLAVDLPSSQMEVLNDDGRERTNGQPPPPPRARRSGSLSQQRSGGRLSADAAAQPGSSAPARNASASTATQGDDAHRPRSAMETTHANGSRQAPSPVGGASLQPPVGGHADWTDYHHTNVSSESAATYGGGGSRTRTVAPVDARSPDRASADTNAPPRTESSQGDRSMGGSWMTSPAARHESLSRQSWVESSAGGHDSGPDGLLQTVLNEEDVEVVEQNSVVSDTSDLYLVRRRIAMEFVSLGSKRSGSSRPLSSRSSRINTDGDAEGDEQGQQNSPRPESMFVGSEKEQRKRREALEAREREMSVEALSKAEMAYAHIEVWTESRRGRWIVTGPASDDALAADRLPDVPSPWAVPIDAKGIVRRKKLKSNVELSSSRTVTVCQDCREVAAMNIAHNCKTCAGSERVEMSYTVQCTVRHAHFLPLKLPAALLMGAKQSHISYLDAADPDHRGYLLRDRALDGLQSSAARVVRAHNAQHGSRLLMGRVTISRCGLLSVCVKSNKNKSRMSFFDVEDGENGKIVEVTPAASSAGSRPSQGRVASGGTDYDRLAPPDAVDVLPSDAVSVRSNTRTEYSTTSKGGGRGGGLLHRGKKKTLSFNRSSPNLQQDARMQASPVPPMPGPAGSGSGSSRLPGHHRNHSDDQTAMAFAAAGREATGKRSLKSLFR